MTYRNRGQDFDRVKNCLESLKKQNNLNFEVILIDSGSNLEVAQKLKSFCKNINIFSIKYIYTETRGHFWNRAYAINLGITKAIKPFVFVLDSDLILPTGFIDYLIDLAHEKKILILRCYDLKPNTDIETLDIRHLPQKINKRPLTGQGNIIVTKSKLQEIGLYDTFYRIWGREDIDLIDRLEKIGLEKTYIDNSKLPVLHQWHTTTSNHLPKAWKEVIKKHHEEKTNLQYQSFTKTLTLEHRPALDLVINQKLDKAKIFRFDYPKVQAFGLFFRQFQALEKGNYLFINQDFSFVRKSSKSKLIFIIDFFNILLKKINISYRLTDIKTNDTEFISSDEMADFLFYVILNLEQNISDYYFERRDNNIFCVIVKK